MLYLISKLYFCLLKIREWCYSVKLLKQHSFSTPIISIGNISVGGTGKTPMIIYISQLLTQQKIKHVIVSRGYKKGGRGSIIVQDYNQQLITDPLIAGDEPVMLTYKIQKIPIVVDSKKERGVALAIQKFSPEVVLLDDGFQSAYITKNTNCLLVDLSMPVTQYSLLPKGKLREPLSSITKSDIVIFIKKFYNKPTIKTVMVPILNKANIPYLDCDVRTTLYRHDYINNKMVIVKNISKINRPIIALSGIGNPQPFMDTVSRFFNNIIIKRAFGDHYNYHKNKHLILSLLENIKGVDGGIVTTLKDYIKIIQLPFMNKKKYNIYILDMNFYIDNEPSFLKKILGKG